MSRATSGRPRLLTAAGGLAVVIATLAFGTAAALSLPAAVIAGSLMAVLILAVLPLWWLPSIALVAFAVLPVGYLTFVPPSIGRFVAPAIVVMAVYLVRSLQQRGLPPRMIAGMLGCTAALLGLSLIGIDPLRSIYWVAVFVVGALLPSLVGTQRDDRMAAALTRTWLIVGAVLGALALLESALRFNPLSQAYLVEQRWSVYRIQTTLGHPLLNGTFFSITACFALFVALRRTSDQVAATAVFVLTGVAAALSGSRSAALALTISMGIGLILSLFSRSVTRAAKVGGVIMVTLTILIVPNLPIFRTRSGSSEGLASETYRDAVLRLGLQLIRQHPLLGSGPGTSAERAQQAGATLPLENAILGTTVSIGLVGMLALAGWLLWLIRQSLRNNRRESLTGLFAFLITGSAYPLWETNPAAWALVGLIALLAGQPLTESTPTAPARSRALLRSGGVR